MTAFIDALADHTNVPETLLSIIPRRLIEWAGRQFINGNIGSPSPKALCRVLAPEFGLPPLKLLDALADEKYGFLVRLSDGSLMLHDWADYGGMVLELREQWAKEKAEWRARKQLLAAELSSRTSGGHPPDKTELSTGHLVDIHRTSAGRPQMSALEGEGEGEDHTHKDADAPYNTPAAAPPAAMLPDDQSAEVTAERAAAFITARYGWSERSRAKQWDAFASAFPTTKRRFVNGAEWVAANKRGSPWAYLGEFIIDRGSSLDEPTVAAATRAAKPRKAKGSHAAPSEPRIGPPASKPSPEAADVPLSPEELAATQALLRDKFGISGDELMRRAEQAGRAEAEH